MKQYSSLDTTYVNVGPIVKPPGEWECYLFGGSKEYGIYWIPPKGEEPNWFWRWMQYLLFGNRWVRRENEN